LEFILFGEVEHDRDRPRKSIFTAQVLE